MKETRYSLENSFNLLQYTCAFFTLKKSLIFCKLSYFVWHGNVFYILIESKLGYVFSKIYIPLNASFKIFFKGLKNWCNPVSLLLVLTSMEEALLFFCLFW